MPALKRENQMRQREILALVADYDPRDDAYGDLFDFIWDMTCVITPDEAPPMDCHEEDLLKIFDDIFTGESL